MAARAAKGKGVLVHVGLAGLAGHAVRADELVGRVRAVMGCAGEA